MSAGRGGRGRPINQQLWPPSGARRDWLRHCDQIHRANGTPSLRTLAKAMHLTSASRVGELLRGTALPVDRAQAGALLQALGAVGPEVDRGIRQYEAAARAEHEEGKRPNSASGTTPAAASPAMPFPGEGPNSESRHQPDLGHDSDVAPSRGPDRSAWAIGIGTSILTFAQLRPDRAVMASLAIACLMIAFLIFRHVRGRTANRAGMALSGLLALVFLISIQFIPAESSQPAASPNPTVTATVTTTVTVTPSPGAGVSAASPGPSGMAPTNVRQNGRFCSKIELMFTPAALARGYRLLRDGAAVKPFDSGSVIDDTVKPGGEHSYEIVALGTNDRVEIGRSTPVIGRTLPVAECSGG